jgi:hypothetical protein
MGAMVGSWRGRGRASGFRRLGVVGIVLGLAACGPAGPGVPGGPGASTSTTVPEIPATTMPGTPPRPTPLVAVGEDGALVVLDGGSPVRTLASGATGGVTLSADRTTAWFEAAGTLMSVPVDGSAPARPVVAGTSPEASPSGARLAYVSGGAVVVRDLATGTERRWTVAGGPLSSLAWSGDGASLVWVRAGTQLMQVAVDAPAAQPRAVPGAVAGPGEQLFATLGLPSGLATVLAGGGPTDGDPHRITVAADLSVTRSTDPLSGGARDRAFDTAWAWGLRTDSHGNLRWSVGGGTGLVAAGYTAADW